MENGNKDQGFYFEVPPDAERAKRVSISKSALGKSLKARRRQASGEYTATEKSSRENMHRHTNTLREGNQTGEEHSHHHNHRHHHSSHHSHHEHGEGRRVSSGGRQHHGGTSSRKRKSGKKRVARALIIAASVILILTMIPVGLFFVMRERGKSDFDPAIVDPGQVNVDNAIVYDEGKTLIYNGKKYVYNENVIPIAFLGIDKMDMDDEKNSSGKSTSQSDMNMVGVIDTESGKVTFILIPRDTFVDVDVYDEGVRIGIQKMQLCLAYAYGDGKYGSCDNTVASIERVLCGIDIDHYVAIELNGIGAMADAVGGVELESLETIGDFREGESLVLKGDLAREYVQIRDTNVFNSDAMRRARQIQFVKAFAKKTYSQVFSDFGTVRRLLRIANEHTLSDLSAENVTYLASLIVRKKNFSVDDMIVLDGEVGVEDDHVVVKPDPEKVLETVLSVFYKEAE